MNIQILQYEFLGPIKLQEWGPPMEKVVYLILSRQKDSFNVIYAGECEHTFDEKFFTKHPSFKCWTNSSPENLLYLAILPLFKSGIESRIKILDRIIARYNPTCNLEIKSEFKPEYKIHPKLNSQNMPIQTPCYCCGSDMKVERVLENTIVIRCIKCGLSDTRLNS